MDTSIAFLLIAAVLFVVIVPAVLKRSAAPEPGSLADRTRTVDVERATRCAVDDARPQLLRDASHPARVGLPEPAVPIVPTAPSLRLQAARPALEVVDGPARTAAEHASPADDVESAVEAPVLPMAVGSPQLVDLSADHAAHARPTGERAQVIALAPPPHRGTVVASLGPTASQPMEPTMTSSHRPPSRRVAAAAERMPADLPADIRARLAQPARPAHGSKGSSSAGRSTSAAAGQASARQRPAAPHRAPMLDARQRKRIRRLRAILPFCGLAVVALTLVTLVCAGFVIAGALPWGVPVVTAALGLASLALVRGLNQEIRAVRAGTAAEAPTPSARTAPERTAREHTTAARTSVTRAAATSAAATRTVLDIEDEPITADLPIVRETAVTAEAHAASDTNASSATASPAAKDESAGTGAANADTSEESASSDVTASSAQRTESDATDATAASDGNAGAEDRSAAPRTRSVFAGSAKTEGPTVAETLARRRTAGEWTPAVLPVPRYVDAAPAPAVEPAPVVADATSYEFTPTDRESLAQQFAEELGYRPALSDAAADVQQNGHTGATGRSAVGQSGSPLTHGRTAIRGSRAGRTSERADRAESAPALGDILARRRA